MFFSDYQRGCDMITTETWRCMESHNRGDIELADALFGRLRPRLMGGPNLALRAADDDACPLCANAGHAAYFSAG